MLNSIFNTFFTVLEFFDYMTWTYIAVPAIIAFGMLLSYKASFFQITKFHKIFSLFINFLKIGDSEKVRGIRPLNAFFAAIGGCMGISNIISVCTAIQIGGPGALFWIWVAALLGMLVKYGEIYLGVKYRVAGADNTYNGGPMYYLKKVDPSGWLSNIFCILMCIYGAEIYMFRVMTQTFSTGWSINPLIIIPFLLCAIIGAGQRGIDQVGKISSVLIPIFLCAFSLISFWLFLNNMQKVIEVVGLIFSHAFTPHAAVGAFAGSSVLVTMTQGMKRACYAGDIGIGYASIIHAESEESVPQRQATLGLFGIFIDTILVCTLSVMLILVTGLWSEPISENMLIATALSNYIPHIKIVWPFFVFLLGYSSLIAFFVVGKKSANYLWPKHGAKLYTVYAIAAFLVFSFVGTEAHILTIMSSTGALLLLINMYGIFKLRNEISFPF
jgi:AGCS family alanine or glycine:cation symporter